MFAYIKIGDLIRFNNNCLTELKNKIGIIVGEKYEPKILKSNFCILFSDKNIIVFPKPILIYYLDIDKVTILNK